MRRHDNRSNKEAGMRFGRLVLIQRGKDKDYGYVKHSTWMCKCDCGKIVTVTSCSLATGTTKSCGCLNNELIHNRIKHGHARWKNQSIYYSTWLRMNTRCYNKKNQDYKNYGGRGIKVSEEFKDPKKFIDYILQNLGERPENNSLDRINNDGNYERGNLRWATRKTQANNRHHGNRWTNRTRSAN